MDSILPWMKKASTFFFYWCWAMSNGCKILFESFLGVAVEFMSHFPATLFLSSCRVVAPEEEEEEEEEEARGVPKRSACPRCCQGTLLQGVPPHLPL
jgi:hypothetical protein